MTLAMCKGENLHLVGKVIRCGRHWCPICGQAKSEAHRRRYARILSRLQQLGHLGCLTLTWPLEARAGLRSREALAEVGRQVVAELKKLGFRRGLRCWHWFGVPPCPKCGNRHAIADNPGGQGATCGACGQAYLWRWSSPPWHPHLNLYLDSGWWSPALMEAVKTVLRARVFPAPYDIHYRWVTDPARMVHKARYLTRATFRAWEWDPFMARVLKGFRNMSWWGRWDGPALWDLPAADLAEVAPLLAVGRGECAACSAPLDWPGEVVPVSLFEVEKDLGSGFLLLRGPPRQEGLGDEERAKWRLLMGRGPGMVGRVESGDGAGVLPVRGREDAGQGS